VDFLKNNPATIVISSVFTDMLCLEMGLFVGFFLIIQQQLLIGGICSRNGRNVLVVVNSLT
jgi:hypothetical protein